MRRCAYDSFIPFTKITKLVVTKWYRRVHAFINKDALHTYPIIHTQISRFSSKWYCLSSFLRSRHEENPSPLERDSMSSFIPPPTKLFPNVSKTTFNGGLARRKDLYINQRQDKAREICRFTCFDSRREYWPEERRKAGKLDWLEVSGST